MFTQLDIASWICTARNEWGRDIEERWLEDSDSYPDVDEYIARYIITMLKPSFDALGWDVYNLLLNLDSRHKYTGFLGLRHPTGPHEYARAARDHLKNALGDAK